jgi:hypothetical protein
MPSTTAAEDREWERMKKERGTGTRAQCVMRNTRRLRDEAEISTAELKEFLQLKVVAKPESILSRDNQNEAAHTLPVEIMAYHLQRLFRAIPDGKAEAVLEKVFMWICGKSWEEAIVWQDSRVISREGLEGPRGMERVPGKETEFSGFFQDDNVQVGRFF